MLLLVNQKYPSPFSCIIVYGGQHDNYRPLLDSDVQNPKKKGLELLKHLAFIITFELKIRWSMKVIYESRSNPQFHLQDRSIPHSCSHIMNNDSNILDNYDFVSTHQLIPTYLY